jgi:D-proline reductase (dithiol) PrdB
MQFDLEKFKPEYDKWAAEYQSEFEAGNVQEAVKHYPLLTPNGVPWTPFIGEPSEKTFALVTSGGLYLKSGQPAFNIDSIHGDTSFREIPKSIRPEELGISHGRYDPSLAEQDLNTIFPIDRFKELESEGVIGKLVDTHYSFSYVNDVVTFVSKTIPEVIERIKAQGVDALFLVPV